jgi:hypothetical protein
MQDDALLPLEHCLQLLAHLLMSKVLMVASRLLVTSPNSGIH